MRKGAQPYRNRDLHCRMDQPMGRVIKKAHKSSESSRKEKSLESGVWDAACSIRDAKDMPKHGDHILPLIFNKRLGDLFNVEVDRIAAEQENRHNE